MRERVRAYATGTSPTRCVCVETWWQVRAGVLDHAARASVPEQEARGGRDRVWTAADPLLARAVGGKPRHLQTL